MKCLPIFLISLIYLLVLGCSHSAKQESITNYEDNIKGTWILQNIKTRNEWPTKEMKFSDTIQFLSNNDCILRNWALTTYFINNDTLKVHIINWGIFDFRILSLKNDSLNLQFIHKEIFADGINEAVSNSQIMQFKKNSSND